MISEDPAFSMEKLLEAAILHNDEELRCMALDVVCARLVVISFAAICFLSHNKIHLLVPSLLRNRLPSSFTSWNCSSAAASSPPPPPFVSGVW